jgi:glucose-1-phosphate thymidylyltransferase
MVSKAIVLAADPVAELPLANRPLLAHVLHTLTESGISQAVVVGSASIRSRLESHLGEVREHCVVRFTEPAPAGGLPATLGGLEGFIDGDPFVLHLGDSLSRTSLRSLLPAALSPWDTIVLVEELHDANTVTELAPRRLDPAANGPRDARHDAPAGAWVLGGGLPEVTRDLPASGNWELEIATMTRRLASRGGHIAKREVADWWRYRQRPGALLEGNRFALEGLSGRPVEAELFDTRIQGIVSIDPSARLESSIVRGPAIIGEGVRIRDAYIGPYTAIGDGVIIEGAEIEHSIILPGASISHLGGRLEASIVGPRARVFRDFRLPKALRLNVGEGAEVSLA